MNWRPSSGPTSWPSLIPTYPVIHGRPTALRIINGLLLTSAAALAIGLAARWIGLREALMLAAPAVQFTFYRHRLRRAAGEVSHADCTAITWLGAALLTTYLVGTHLWLTAGLPSNVFLGQ